MLCYYNMLFYSLQRRRLMGKPNVIWPPIDYIDSDLEVERYRIDTMSAEERRGGDLITIHDLTKSYDTRCSCSGQSTLAVNQMTIGIERGECFCLLGINGSGKTTTLKMLTAELVPTYGRAFIAGHDVTTEWKQVQNALRQKVR